MDSKWIREARKHQVMHALCCNEGGTVRSIAATAKLSVAYTHQLLADLVGEGQVVRQATESARRGVVVTYHSLFHYATLLYADGVFGEPGSEIAEMQYAYTMRNCDSMQWYGWKPLDIDLPTQIELPF